MIFHIQYMYSLDSSVSYEWASYWSAVCCVDCSCTQQHPEHQREMLIAPRMSPPPAVLMLFFIQFCYCHIDLALSFFILLLPVIYNKLCGRPPQYAPPPASWLLTLKVVSESRVTWDTSVTILVFLGLCSRLRPNVSDWQTSDVHHPLMPSPYGGGA